MIIKHKGSMSLHCKNIFIAVFFMSAHQCNITATEINEDIANWF